MNGGQCGRCLARWHGGAGSADAPGLHGRAGRWHQRHQHHRSRNGAAGRSGTCPASCRSSRAHAFPCGSERLIGTCSPNAQRVPPKLFGEWLHASSHAHLQARTASGHCLDTLLLPDSCIFACSQTNRRRRCWHALCGAGAQDAHGESWMGHVGGPESCLNCHELMHTCRVHRV